ncbi:MAG TPA: radical SAM protein [Myxococcota bacterium]|nr:radical SAM protein [Myxococcota bacterium]
MAEVLLIKAWAPGVDDRAMVPPIGVMQLAGILRQAGHQVRLLHVGPIAVSREKILNAVADKRPDVIGISAITTEFLVYREIAGLLNESFPGIPVMAGGPLASSNPPAALGVPGVSVIAVGEADVTILELVDALAAGRDPAGLPGTAVLRNNIVVRGPNREPLTPAELDALPLPAWDLLDLDEHFRRRGMASVGIRPYMQVMTSRGCPYQCAYCHGLMGRRYRARSPESVVNELRALREYFDIHEFEIVDDCFNLDRPRMHAILQGLIDFKDPLLRLQFPGGLRSDILEKEDILMLRRAGTNFISFAIETASPRLQKMVRKNLNIERALESISTAADAGIFCNGFFMLGFPTETAEECRATIDLACSTRLHEALFFKVNPFRGTEMFDMAVQMSGLDPAAIPLEEMDYFNVRHNLSAMPDAEFERLWTGAYRRFYFNPSRIIRIILRHPRKLQLLMYLPQVVRKTVKSLLGGHMRMPGASKAGRNSGDKEN